MTDPYLIEGPALISFSGGRTSAYLLKHVLDAYGGTLPGNVTACFANTVKEMPQTLDFVRDCGQRWIRRRGGGSWSREGRPRTDRHPTQTKLLWELAKFAGHTLRVDNS
jgi:hypothetical protein